MCPIYIDWDWAGIHIHGYEGLYYLIAFVVGYLVLRRHVLRDNFMDKKLLESFMVYLVFAAAIGARLFHFIFWDPGKFFSNPLIFFRFPEGGASETGGIAFGLAVAIYFAKRYNISLLRFGDYLVAPASIGIAVGRIGCFLNGDSYGFPTNMPWGVVFSPKSLAYHEFGAKKLHPTQLYEVLLMAIVFVIFLYMRRRDMFPKRRLFLFFVFYGMVRFFLEIYRADRVAMFDVPFGFVSVDPIHPYSVSTGQFISLLFILFGLIGFYIVGKRLTRDNDGL